MLAQSLWLRILTRVDDYGRYDARPSVLAGELFSVWNELHPEDVVTPQRIPALSCELQRSLLADFYTIDGKNYVQLLQWQERVRENAKEKWPANPNPLRNPAESCGILPPSPSSSPPSSPSPSSPSSPVACVGDILKTAAGIAGNMRVNNQRQNEKDLNLSALLQIQSKLNEVYKRPPEQRWVYSEEQALSEVSRRPGVLRELAHIFYFRAQMPADDRRRFFPQCIEKLLSNWSATLDKARIQAPMPRVQAAKMPANRPTEMPIEQARKLWDKAKGEAKV